MGYYVNISVVFACDNNNAVASLAKEHLKLFEVELPQDSEWPEKNYDEKNTLWDSWEAMCFLCDMAHKTGHNPGPKGGLSFWGIIGNYTNPELFIDDLSGFFYDLLLNSVDGGPLPHEHIIVFYEKEQSDQANCYEVYVERDTKNLVIKHHTNLPFAWRQA